MTRSKLQYFRPGTLLQWHEPQKSHNVTLQERVSSMSPSDVTEKLLKTEDGSTLRFDGQELKVSEPARSKMQSVTLIEEIIPRSSGTRIMQYTHKKLLSHHHFFMQQCMLYGHVPEQSQYFAAAKITRKLNASRFAQVTDVSASIASPPPPSANSEDDSPSKSTQERNAGETRAEVLGPAIAVPVGVFLIVIGVTVFVVVRKNRLSSADRYAVGSGGVEEQV